MEAKSSFKRPDGLRDAVQRLKQLWPTLRSARPSLAAVGVMLCVSTAFAMIPPAVSGRIMDALVAHDIRVLVIWLAIQIACGFARLGIGELQTVVTRRFSHACNKAIRVAALTKVHHAELRALDKRTLGELINRIEGDVEGVAAAILGLFPIIGALISLVWLLIMMPLTEWRLAAVAYPFLIVWALTFLRVGGKVRSAGVRTGQARDAFVTILSESLSFAGLVRVKSFVKSKPEIAKLIDRYDELYRLHRDHYYASRSMVVWQTAVMTVAPAALAFAGVYMLISGYCTLGTITMFTGYFSQAFSPASELALANSRAMALVVNADRLEELLSVPSERPNGHPLVIRGNIEFEEVAFSFAAPLIEDFSCTVTRGDKVLLRGPSGVGKSTLLRMIMGFYTPAAGRILFEGIAATTLDLECLRRQIAYVPQDAQLFYGTVRENISYARPCDQEELDRVIALCGLRDVVAGLPQGLDTLVEAAGIRLSGGQRQRLAIARALLADAEMLILDEATSAIDAQSEREIMEALCEIYRDRTVWVVSHRPAPNFAPTKIIDVGARLLATAS